jgi:hypothetical protein
MNPPVRPEGPTPEGQGESPRITSLPFLYTAPVALTIAGGLLWHWGALALSNPWSSLTLALTHTITLGFLTMTALGAFYALASREGAAGIARPRLGHLVYYCLLLTALGLVWGTSQSQSMPVFVAIGGAGVAVVVFVFQAARALRRSVGGGAAIRGLRLALWGFSLAAFLGVWLAHGHGGMRFPGLRSLWMQVHLCIALVGWLGGVLVALSLVALPANFGAPVLEKKPLDGVLGLTAAGIFVPFVLLLYGYFFVPTHSQGWIEPWALGALVPAMVAIWLIHPGLCLSSLASGARGPGLRHWQLGLALGPAVFLVGIAAWFRGDVRLGMLFGWLAVLGWAGTLFSGLLVSTIPWLIARRDSSPAPADALAWLSGGSHLSLVLHGAALVAGAGGILAQSDPLCRLAGGLVFLDGAWLLILLTRVLLGGRPRARAPG